MAQEIKQENKKLILEGEKVTDGIDYYSDRV